LEISSRDGELTPFVLQPRKIFGLGLTYPGHIEETQCWFNPSEMPPVFKKDLVSLNPDHSPVKLPSHDEIIVLLEEIEPAARGRFQHTAEVAILGVH
jgi:2-keto-4-pentenoate hydratase/2-oxohepta-3-ene-1,7-dioic acid hydratase in catechol pathway